MENTKNALLRTRRFFSNRLLSRKQMIVDIIHPGRRALSREAICDLLARKFKTTSDVVFAFGFRTKFGGGKSSGFVNVYDSADFAIKFEPKHRLLRNGLLVVTERKARVLRKKTKNEMKNIRGIAKLTGIPRQKKSKN
nr:unnamed protein product [Spirometra erinaceieuropaei]